MKLKVGDKVTSDYKNQEATIIRKITYIKKMDGYGSGYCASADGGKSCKYCKRPLGTPIKYVDANWFEPVK